MSAGVPTLIELGRLLQITDRILRNEETDEDLQIIFAPGSSLGGARPKASVIDQHSRLAIAKFPKETDDYSIELWESVALTLARCAGIRTPDHELIRVAERSVLLVKRFDRTEGTRVDEATCDLELALASAELFGISLTEAKAISKEVGAVVATWREVATAAGATQSEILRMTSAFEHDDLARARAL